MLCAALRGLSLRNSAILTKKIKARLLDFRFLIAVTLGCFSYFNTDFKIGFAISSAKRFVSLHSGIFKFFRMFDVLGKDFAIFY